MNDSLKIFDEIVDIPINCEEDLGKIEEKLKEYKIIKYKIECDMAYDSCGYDVYYYAVSWIHNDELEMITGTYDCC